MKNEEWDRVVISDVPGQKKSRMEQMVSGNGELKLDGDLEITGYFSGMLTLNGNLTIAKNTRIIGDIIAQNMTVHGRMIGSATISGKARFIEGSEFSGRLYAGEAEIDEGCKVSGIRRLSTPAVLLPRIRKEIKEIKEIQEPVAEYKKRPEPVTPRVNKPIFII
jgi:cytoskeletal protein CcmA (bactofilin family)